jgi:hypothetical protein
MPPSKHIAALPPPLQLAHHCHHLGRITRRDTAALMQDICQLAIRQLLYMQLQKPAPKSAAEGFAARVGAGGVLRCEEHEVGVGPYNFLQLWYKQLAIVIQQPA